MIRAEVSVPMLHLKEEGTVMSIAFRRSMGTTVVTTEIPHTDFLNVLHFNGAVTVPMGMVQEDVWVILHCN